MKNRSCAFIRRAIGFFMCALFIFLGVCSAAAQEEGVDFSSGAPDTSEATAVYLYNFESDEVLLSKNLDVSISPSATVKMMTGLLAIEHFRNDFSEKITVSAAMLNGVSGNTMGIEAGETYSAEELIYATVCGGFNDAATALAHKISGSEIAFVRKMNERAMEWGMISTTYANSTGIMSTATTTLRDVILLSRKAYENEKYLAASSAVRYEIAADADSPAHTVTNRNSLIYGHDVEYRNLYARGLCAGTDTDMGYCVSTVVKKNGLSYLCVVMGSYRAGENTYSYIVANRLCSWALSSFGYRTVIDKELFSHKIGITMSDTVNEINAVPQESVSVFLPDTLEDSELEFCVRLHSATAKAPIKQGDELGYLIVVANGEEIARTLLVSDTDVNASSLMVVMEKMGAFTRSRFFIIFAITLTLVSIGAVITVTTLTKRAKKRNKYKYNL